MSKVWPTLCDRAGSLCWPAFRWDYIICNLFKPRFVAAAPTSSPDLVLEPAAEGQSVLAGHTSTNVADAGRRAANYQPKWHWFHWFEFKYWIVQLTATGMNPCGKAFGFVLQILHACTNWREVRRIVPPTASHCYCDSVQSSRFGEEAFLVCSTEIVIGAGSPFPTRISRNFFFQEFIFLAVIPGTLPRVSRQSYLLVPGGVLRWSNIVSILPLICAHLTQTAASSELRRPVRDTPSFQRRRRWLLGSVPVLAGKVSQQLPEVRYLGWSSLPKRQQFYFHSPHSAKHWHLDSRTRLKLGDLDERVNLSGRPWRHGTISHMVAEVLLLAFCAFSCAVDLIPIL